MTPTHAQKGSRRYRYYVSQAVLQRKPERGSISRIPAPEIERLVIGALRARRSHPELSDGDLIVNHLHRVTIHPDRIDIAIKHDDGGSDPFALVTTVSPAPPDIVAPCSAPDLRPMKVEDRTRILKAIARGRAWLDELVSGEMASTEAIAFRERCSERSIRMKLSLAFLSPEVVQAIVAGRLPRGIGMTALAHLPHSWSAQHAALGLYIAK